jgi:hypothetical protein
MRPITCPIPPIASTAARVSAWIASIRLPISR